MSNYVGADNLEVMVEAVNYNNYLVDLITRFANKDSVTVDFGAGSGTFAEILKKLGYKLLCIEPDILLSEKIKKNNILVFSSLNKLDEKANSIYSLNVLEHIEDDISAMSSIHQCLLPGGIATIYVPAFQILFSSMDKKVGHYRRYSKKDLESKMKSVGFEILSVKYVDTLGFIATLLYKLVGSKDGNISKKSIVFYDRILFPISTILDRLFFYSFGKNIILYAKKI